MAWQAKDIEKISTALKLIGRGDGVWRLERSSGLEFLKFLFRSIGCDANRFLKIHTHTIIMKKNNRKKWISGGGLVLIVGLIAVIVYELDEDRAYCEYMNSWPNGVRVRIKGDLQNLYLACNAFWADAGGQKKCTLAIVKDEEYGFVPSKDLVECFPSYTQAIKISGAQADFRASAWVERQVRSEPVIEAFKIDASGKVEEMKKTEPQKKP